MARGVPKTRTFVVAITISLVAHAAVAALLSGIMIGRGFDREVAVRTNTLPTQPIKVRLAMPEPEFVPAPDPDPDADTDTDTVRVPVAVPEAQVTVEPVPFESTPAPDAIVVPVEVSTPPPVFVPVRATPPPEEPVALREPDPVPAQRRAPERGPVDLPEPATIAPEPAPVEMPEITTPARSPVPAPGVPALVAAATVSLPKPTYPKRSIRRGHEGIVVLHVEVRADGSVGAVKVGETSGHKALDDAARKAVRKARFSAATRDGVPYASTIEVPYEFRLE